MFLVCIFIKYSLRQGGYVFTPVRLSVGLVVHKNNWADLAMKKNLVIQV